MLIAGTDHADDLQQRQRGDFFGIQAQRATRQYSLDLPAVGLDGLGAFGGRRCQDHMKVIAFDDGQVFVDGFDQDQNSGCHRTALPEGFESKSMRDLSAKSLCCGRKIVVGPSLQVLGATRAPYGICVVRN